MEYSIVIPVYNEEGSVSELYKQLTMELSKLDSSYEIIFVDDGSYDSTLRQLLKLRKSDEHVKVLSFNRNFGKSQALMAGFNYAKGKIVFTMDGDLQDEPKEIPRFIEKLNEGYDMVTGWKYIRHDPLAKTIPSKFFNWLTASITGAKVHDSNCGYKAYRREVIKRLKLYKGFHRYIPAIVKEMGFRVTEIKVTHHPRKHGESKYGSERLIKGILDLITLRFIYPKSNKSQKRNGSLEKIAGMVCIVASLVFIALSNFINFSENGIILLMLPVVLIPFGIILISFGFLSHRFWLISVKNQKYVLKKI
jgi:glycosyltransferase involved in cell wall biosynthesis